MSYPCVVTRTVTSKYIFKKFKKRTLETEYIWAYFAFF